MSIARFWTCLYLLIHALEGGVQNRTQWCKRWVLENFHQRIFGWGSNKSTIWILSGLLHFVQWIHKGPWDNELQLCAWKIDQHQPSTLAGQECLTNDHSSFSILYHSKVQRSAFVKYGQHNFACSITQDLFDIFFQIYHNQSLKVEGATPFMESSVTYYLESHNAITLT
jgi:hypothetical protein